MNEQEHNQALLEALLEEYAKKGYNPQAVLSNSLFQQLSVGAKIALLRDNLEKLSGKPTFLGALNTTKIVPMSLLAGAGGALSAEAISGAGFTAGLGLKAGLVGAATAAIPALLAARANYKSDLKTRDQVRDNKYLNAIISRSSSGLRGPTPIKLLETVGAGITAKMAAPTITE